MEWIVGVCMGFSMLAGYFFGRADGAEAERLRWVRGLYRTGGSDD